MLSFRRGKKNERERARVPARILSDWLIARWRFVRGFNGSFRGRAASTGEAESKMRARNRFRSAAGDPRYLRELKFRSFFVSSEFNFSGRYVLLG